MVLISFCRSFSSCLVTLSIYTSCSFFASADCSKYSLPMISKFSQLFSSFDPTEDGEDDALSLECA